jgi:hypothetical protein
VSGVVSTHPDDIERKTVDEAVDRLRLHP